MNHPKMRVPKRFYDYIKEKAQRNNTKMTNETDNMFNKFLENESTLKKLEGKRVFIIK
jgi:hypothetical protein